MAARKMLHEVRQSARKASDQSDITVSARAVFWVGDDGLENPQRLSASQTPPPGSG